MTSSSNPVEIPHAVCSAYSRKTPPVATGFVMLIMGALAQG